MTQDDDIKALRDALEVAKVWPLSPVARANPARIARLLDRLEAAEADAGRYRWLRAGTRGQQDARRRQEFELPDPHPLGDIMRGSVAQHLDAAIDAAMQAKEPQT